MYRGFNIKLNLENETHFQYWKSLGEKHYTENSQLVQFSLNNFVNTDNSLDAAAIQNSWFPQIEADIFISHSHKNIGTAIALSGWIWENFKLKSFIDSCIWGYSNDLQREIDNEHCYIQSRGVYSYELRNHSTSHVHMMLSTALTMMIDNSECLFFLNTPNSISTTDIIYKTESPWIYAEIAMTQIIRQNIPRRRLVSETKYFSKGGVINEQLKVQYELDLTHLTDIDIDTLILWHKNHTKTNADDALDKLYCLKPVNTNILYD